MLHKNVQVANLATLGMDVLGDNCALVEFDFKQLFSYRFAASVAFFFSFGDIDCSNPLPRVRLTYEARMIIFMLNIRVVGK
jgi:hypothetical protein